jgi:hypothetical protein
VGLSRFLGRFLGCKCPARPAAAGSLLRFIFQFDQARDGVAGEFDGTGVPHSGQRSGLARRS